MKSSTADTVSFTHFLRCDMYCADNIAPTRRNKLSHTRVNKFLVSDPAPTIETFLARTDTVSTSGGSVGRRQCKSTVPQQGPAQKGELACFMTIAKEGSSVVADVNTFTQAGCGKSLTSKPAVVRSLEDVWLKGMFDKPAELGSIDPDTVMKPVRAHEKLPGDGTDGKEAPSQVIHPEKNICITKNVILVPRYEPLRFERNIVQQSHIVMEEADASIFSFNGSGHDVALMSPKQRRIRHDTFVNAKLGEAILKSAYRAKAKLVRNCQKNYPDGALNIQESPFSEMGPMSYAYDDNRHKFAKDMRVSMKIGKGHGVQRPTVIQDILKHDK